jgi:hypothetical protein
MKHTVIPSSTLDLVETLVTDLRRFAGDIAAACEYTHGTHEYEDIVSMVLSGRLNFFPLNQSFFITEVQEYPRAKHYHLFLAGGNKHEIIAYFPELRRIARELGCSKLTMSGRPGWTRTLTDHGWKNASYSMTTSTETDDGR